MFVIAFEDDDGFVFWRTRCGSTDNYTSEIVEATKFTALSDARCLIKALDLGDDHVVIQF